MAAVKKIYLDESDVGISGSVTDRLDRLVLTYRLDPVSYRVNIMLLRIA
jgi:hypothetical protein